MSTNSVNIKVGLDGSEFNKGIEATMAQFNSLKTTVNQNKISWQEANLELKKYEQEFKSASTQTQEMKDKQAALKAAVETNKLAYSEAKLSLEKYKNEMGDIKNTATGAKSSISGFSTALGAMGVGFSVIGIVGGIKTVGAAYETYLKQVNILRSELVATGDASGETVDQLEVMAKKYENLTGITDENIMTAQNMILTYRNIGSDIFPHVTQATLDMATVMNHGITPDASLLTETALRLGKALNDPIKGMTALSRVGVQFTQVQKDQIVQMVKSGDGLSAQKLILGELDKEFGGAAHSAETMGNKYTVAVDEMQKATGHFVEGGAGKAFLNWLDSGINKTTALINKIRIYSSSISDLSINDAKAKLSSLDANEKKYTNKFAWNKAGAKDVYDEHYAAERNALAKRIIELRKQEAQDAAKAKSSSNNGIGENSFNLGSTHNKKKKRGAKGEDAYQKAENNYQDYLSNEEIRGVELTNDQKLAAYNKYLGNVKKTEKEATDYKKGQAQLVKEVDKESVDYKLAQLDVEKYATEKTDDEIYQIDLEKINLKLSKEREGTVAYEQLLAEKYQLEREHEKKIKDLKAQGIIDDLEFNDQELDNKISTLDLEVKQHKITEEKKLKQTIEYLEQKKQLEANALNEQLSLVKGNSSEEIKVKRSSYKNTESINNQENDAKTALWEKQHAGFVEFTDSLKTGWGDTVSSFIKGDANIGDVWTGLMVDVVDAFGDAIGKMVEKYMESGISNMVKSFAGGATGGGILSGIGSLFGGFFAEGGDPPVGKVSEIGEKGPEWFIPKTAGTIVPNDIINKATSSSTNTSSKSQSQQQPMIINNNKIIQTKATKEDVYSALKEDERTFFSFLGSGIQYNKGGFRTAIKGIG